MTETWEVAVVSSDPALYVDYEYDIFQSLPNGDVRWRGSIIGRDKAIAKLKEWGTKSPNEHFLFHAATKTVIARLKRRE
jgi:hypothetical protein